MNRLLCIVLLVVAAVTASAQNGINSPFSQYGVGLNNAPFSFPGFASMGGITSIRSANNMVNPFNPASYAAIGKETLVFDMGVNIEMSTLRSGDDEQYDSDGNLGYLAIAFPLSKWWKTALAVMPFSDVDYKTVQTSTIEPGGEVKTLYRGQGSVTQLLWGNGFNILGGADESKQQLRVGFNISLLYGDIDRYVSYEFPGNDSTYFMNSQREKNSYIKNFVYDFGVQYERPLGDKYRLMAGVTLKPHQTLSINENALAYTFVEGSSSISILDTIFPQRGGSSDYNSTLEQPMSIGLGLSLQRNSRWLLAVDASMASWNGMKYTENSNNNLFGTSPLRYSDNRRCALGFQLLGDKNDSRYFRRITFSAGLHYESGKLCLELTDGNRYDLNEWGAGVGASLPMRKGRSVLNLSVSYSSFGDQTLLRRDAVLFGISVGSCESWFVKRKFN